jgi:thioredoxin-like negative regulator of GroEL
MTPDISFPQLTQFDFHTRMAALRGTALIIFTGPACGACRSWKQLLGSYRRRHPDLAVFEIDAAQDTALAREFEVFHLPTLFLFRDGEFHGELQCEANIETIHQSVNRMLSQPPREMP